MKKLVLFTLALAAVLSCGGPAEKQQTTMETIFSRKSVRSYTQQEVSAEQVERLLRAAMAAPSGINLQPWRFVVVREKSTKEILAGPRNKMIIEAPVAIVICGETTWERQGERVPNGNWTADCAAATQNLLLAAESMGLGAVWTACYPYEDRMTPAREVLGLPDDVMPYCVVPVGYPAGETAPKDKWKPENIHYERW